MKDLIPIKVENDQQLLSARDLHKGLGLKRQFTDWVKQNFKDFEENTDFVFTPQSVNMPNGGTKQIKDYFLTIDMAKQLCLMSRTEKGKEYRKYLIEVERKWNDLFCKSYSIIYHFIHLIYCAFRNKYNTFCAFLVLFF